ncbi:putative reverse transcriptase domain-containing protein [Tanacetum coccineum]
MKIEESLNVTFDETPPPSKTSALVDHDLDEEEESKNHPLDTVIGNLNQRTLRSQAQNKGYCLTSWVSKKETALAISMTEAEYISVELACQQALLMKQALIDYDIRLNEVPIMCDNKGTIDLSKNPVKCKYVTRNTEKCHKNEENADSYEAMAGVDINTLTMEQYLAWSRENQTLGVVKPEIRGNVNFEIKSQFMRELREETFSGNKNVDTHYHVERFLNIVDRLTLGVVNTWDLLKKAFIQRYCPPSKTAKRLEDIHNFKQEIDESLYQAWEWFNDLLYKCPTHDINSHQKESYEEIAYRCSLITLETNRELREECHGGSLCHNEIKCYWESENDGNRMEVEWENLSLNDWLRIRFGEVSETARNQILRDHWKKIENEYDDSDEFEDSDGCGQCRGNENFETIINKLHDEWFKGMDEDEEDLEGIIDYLEQHYMMDLFIQMMKNTRKGSANC